MHAPLKHKQDYTFKPTKFKGVDVPFKELGPALFFIKASPWGNLSTFNTYTTQRIDRNPLYTLLLTNPLLNPIRLEYSILTNPEIRFLNH